MPVLRCLAIGLLPATHGELRHVATSFGALEVHSFGTADRLAVALHGAHDGARDVAVWHSTAAALASAGYQVLCPNLYSLVGTRPGSATNEELTNLVLQLGSWARAGRIALLLGHAWGAGVALRTAALLPNYVERLVVAAPVSHVGITLIRDVNGLPFDMEVSCETAVLGVADSGVRKLLRRAVHVLATAEGLSPAPGDFIDDILHFAARPPVASKVVDSRCSRLGIWQRWREANVAHSVSWNEVTGVPSGWSDPVHEAEATDRVKRLDNLLRSTELSCGKGDEILLRHLAEQDPGFELLRVDRSSGGKVILLHGAVNV